jgi:hypothetical protein
MEQAVFRHTLVKPFICIVINIVNDVIIEKGGINQLLCLIFLILKQ